MEVMIRCSSPPSPGPSLISTAASLTRLRGGPFLSKKGVSMSVQQQRQRREHVSSIGSIVENADFSSSLECLQQMERGHLGDHPDVDSIWKVAELDVSRLTSAASGVRDRGPHSRIVSFSPKVFLPLTRACRDACGYCTFALTPKSGYNIYMTVEEALDIARKGLAFGCTEALFTLGDKPELLYPRARQELAMLGHTTTLSYVAEVAKIVLEETGLLPHINAGVMSRRDIALLRQVSVSQGLMLETLSQRLLQPGAAHYKCPDKVPAARLATIAAAGEEKVPFTSGLLVGIGETREERIMSLLELRNLHQLYGHIQELIIQNFRSKKGTAMENVKEPPLEELQWTIAMARLIFGPSMSIQAPPNLTPRGGTGNGEEWIALIQSGINDWGGISPVTKDWVNPEAPWPELPLLAAVTVKAGKFLVPRLAIYPCYAQNISVWLDPLVSRWVLQHSNSLGFARGEVWSPGVHLQGNSRHELSLPVDWVATEDTGFAYPVNSSNDHVDCGTNISVGIDGTVCSLNGGYSKACSSRWVSHAIEKAMAGLSLKEAEIVQLFNCMGEEFQQICSAADRLRKLVKGDVVTYVVNRNINYTNVCGYKCQFCAFSKGKTSEGLRGNPYMLSLEEIARRVREAWDRGATEVCMQGGIHPDFTGETYLEILRCVKEAAPEIHVHAFSPLEVWQGARTLGLSISNFLLELKKAGLGSLPGTAAEILDDDIRDVLCPDKLTTHEWLEVVRIAHTHGLRSTSTIMFGHVDGPQHWAKHLLLLRELQKETGGLTEFVPLPFVHMQAPLFLKGKSRKGPTRRECILMHAVSRIVLHPHVTNIQASWVKMGPIGAQALLMAGCNDMGGSLMNESITRAAGASHGEELAPSELEALVRSIGRIPMQRTTLYGTPRLEQVTKSFMAVPLEAFPKD